MSPVPVPRALRDYQVEAVQAVHDAWDSDPDARPGVVLPTGAGKPLHDDTEIPVPGGTFVRMGALKVGDKVIGSDGKPTRVVAVDPQGVIPLYRLTFDDCAEVLAGAGHLWTVRRNSRLPRTVTTEWLMNQPGHLLEEWSVPAWVPRKGEARRAILDISPAGTGPATCIQVSNDDGLFACTRDYVMTHNSTVIAKLAVDARAEGKRVVLLAHRGELLKQMAAAVMAVDPSGEEVGLVAGKHNNPSTEIVAASFQTLAKDKRLRSLGHRDILLADECFPAGTLLDDGRSIESIRVGDTVRSWDENSGEFVDATVANTMRSVPTSMVRVVFEDDSEVVCTPGHPFLNTGGEWIPAASLEGRDVVTAVGILRVDRVEVLEPGSDGTYGGLCPDGHVYNFEVEGTHTYLIHGGVVVHNCHHISARTYLEVLVKLGALPERDEDDPDRIITPTWSRTAGFTATMTRSDGKHLGDVWSGVVYEKDVLWAIDHGHLVAPHGKTVKIDGLNKLAKIKNQLGDYRKTELDDVMAASVPSTVDAVVRYAAGRAPIVFAVSVAHARMVAEELTARGMAAEYITGSMSDTKREVVYDAFRNGDIDAMVTVQVLTEGADFPRCDTVVMARPTRSQVLYCFDDETQILTPFGWKSWDELSEGDEAAAVDPHNPGVARWERIEALVRRPLDVSGGEKMVHLDTPTMNFRVTSTHRMSWAARALTHSVRVSAVPKKSGRTTPGQSWRVDTAGRLAQRKSRFLLPVSTRMTSQTDPEALFDESLVSGTEDMVELHTALAWAALSDTHRYPGDPISVYSDRAYRVLKTRLGRTDIPARFDDDGAIDPVRGRVSGRLILDRGHPVTDWWFDNVEKPLSEGRVDDVCRTFRSVSPTRWRTAVNLLLDMCRDRRRSRGGSPEIHLTLPGTAFADWFQAMSVVRGWRCNISPPGRLGKVTAHLSAQLARSVGGQGDLDSRQAMVVEPKPRKGEMVWCVSVPSGGVVTRRRGKAVIMGNCQMLGRSLRPYPGKTDALVLDLTGVSRDMSMVTLSKLHPASTVEVVDAEGNLVIEPEIFEHGDGPKPPRKERIGTLDLEDIDLLKRSDANWLKTAAGVRFLDVRSGFLFVWPPNPTPEDSCQLGYVPQNSTQWEWFKNSDGQPVSATLTDAITAAEHYAEYVYHSITRRNASWRKKLPPSDAQVNYALSLGITEPDKKTRARLADDISVAKADRVLPVPAGWTPTPKVAGSGDTSTGSEI
jgi:superfamily II DNA or RNA helicase